MKPRKARKLVTIIISPVRFATVEGTKIKCDRIGIK